MNGDIELFPRTNRPSIGMSIAASTIFGNNEIAIQSQGSDRHRDEHLENLQPPIKSRSAFNPLPPP